MTVTRHFTINEVKDTLTKGGYAYSYSGNPDLVLEGLSDPGEYEPHTAIWLGNTRYLRLPAELSEADVMLVFARENLEGIEYFQNVIICDDPRNAFLCLADTLVEKVSYSEISQEAQIDSSAEIGSDVYVGANAIIGRNVVIGDKAVIMPGAVIKDGSIIGARCQIMEGTVIGNEGFGFKVRQDGSRQRVPHLGIVRIGDDVEIGSNCVIDRGTFRDTVIGAGTKLDSLTCISHNVHIGQNCLIVGGVIHGNCTIGDGCELIRTTCKNRIRIGNRVRTGIGSVVIKDIPDECHVFGNPARIMPS